jgi:hypothetical protein
LARRPGGATPLNDLRRSRLVALSTLMIGCTVTLAAPGYLAAVTAAAILVTLAAFESRHPTDYARANRAAI